MATSFADLLRQHRLAARLTQEALAERAGLSVNGIQKLESGGTRPYRETVRRLIEALEVTPDKLVAFQAAAQPQPRQRPGAAPSTDNRHELPAALTSFIGREAELDEITQLLPTTRLLTLTGVGGCGKTRLALETARLVGVGYADGVRLIELAPVADAALVPHAVAAALDIREMPTQPLVTTIIATLREQRLLVLLDNCEHLLEACAQLADVLLRACPGLHILATSREPLGISGEVSRPVPSLAVPPLELISKPTAADLGQYASVQLFLDRACAFSPNVAVTDRNASAIAQICQRLDGIPLALELAAALIRGLSVEEIAARLDQRFQLLTGGSRAALPRQQTLQATIDWSYALLSASEQTLFARLSVFLGRWSLDAAEGICSGNGIEREQVLGLLLHLVDKSLVVVEDENDEGSRYRLLDTLRQYGRERLLASGESEAVHRQHASYFLALSEQAEHELNQSHQADWIERLALHQSDLLAAVDWLVVHGEVQDALELGGVLGSFWQIRGQPREGHRRLALLLDLPGAAAPTLARAKALYGAGLLTLYEGDLPATRAFLKESLALYRHHQHLSGVAWVLIHLGWLCHDHFRFKAARRFLREALVLCRQLDDRRGLARCLNVQGMVANSSGDVGLAYSLHQECLALSREVGDRWGTAWALTNLGWDLMILAELSQGAGDPDAAEAALEEGLAIWQELGERRHIAFSEMNLGVVNVLQGRLRLAHVRLLKALSAFTDMHDLVAMGITLTNWSMLSWAQGQLEQFVRLLAASRAQMQIRATYQRDHPCAPIMDQHLEAARASLGQARFDAAWADGSAMTLDAALAYLRQPGDH